MKTPSRSPIQGEAIYTPPLKWRRVATRCDHKQISGPELMTSFLGHFFATRDGCSLSRSAMHAVSTSATSACVRLVVVDQCGPLWGVRDEGVVMDAKMMAAAELRAAISHMKIIINECAL